MRFFGVLCFFLLSSISDGAEYINSKGKKRKIPELHHILGVQLLESMNPPKTFVVAKDRSLQCKTCHGIQDIAELPVDKININVDNFLRGGRYQKATDFCYNCHQRQANTRKNIHIMLNTKGKIIERQCKYCHEKVQDQNKAKKITDIKLRQPAETLCYGCHLKTPHLNALEHLVELKDQKLAQWKKTAKTLYMPLTASGKIMCITCHTPHQKGVITASLGVNKQVEDVDLEEGVLYKNHPWSQVYAMDKKNRLDKLNQTIGKNITLNYKRIKAEVLLRLPAKNGELCLSCHTFDY